MDRPLKPQRIFNWEVTVRVRVLEEMTGGVLKLHFQRGNKSYAELEVPLDRSILAVVRPSGNKVIPVDRFVKIDHGAQIEAFVEFVAIHQKIMGVFKKIPVIDV